MSLVTKGLGGGNLITHGLGGQFILFFQKLYMKFRKPTIEMKFRINKTVQKWRDKTWQNTK